MIIPPMLLRVRVQNGRRRFGLWLPLFLLWPPVFLLGLALIPLVLVLAGMLWPWGWGRPLLLTGPAIFRLFCALRGLRVDVHDPPEQVYIAFR